MAQEEILPARLQYLQPFREFLKQLPKADVDDADTTLLEELLRNRIQGMTATEAQGELNADLNELESYLSVPRRRNDRLHFVVGFLLIAVEKPEEFFKPPESPKIILERLTMELPPKARSSVDEYSLTVTWKGQDFHALRVNMDDDFSREITRAKLAHPNASEDEVLKFTLAKLQHPNASPDELLKLAGEIGAKLGSEIRPQTIPVHLGEVVGHKCVSFFISKRVDYLLEIPGGIVSVSISAERLFDESEWDAYLATLRFKDPSA